MADVVERLKQPRYREPLMKRWDEWRRLHKDGFGGSATRDEFESIIDDIDEERAEAAREIETLRARLSQAGAGGGVVVKALEWEDKPGVRFADTRIGTYWAYADGTLKLDDVQLSFDRSRHWSQTQAAAQADYETRILAALAPSPSAGESTGWKLVPVEASDEMLKALYPHVGQLPGILRMCWREVLAAAPTPPATPVQPTASVEAVAVEAAQNIVRDWVAFFNDERARAAGKIVLDLLASLPPAPTQGGGA